MKMQTRQKTLLFSGSEPIFSRNAPDVNMQTIPFFQKDSKCGTSVEGGFDYNGEKEADYH